MVKPYKDYHPPQGWVKFETLPKGAKFHNVETRGMPTQYIKVESDFGTHAVNTDTGDLVKIDADEFVYPVDNGWIAELACYGFNKKELQEIMTKGGHRKVVSYVMNHCEANKAHRAWEREVERYFPQLGVMSFRGPRFTIDWLMKRVTPIEPEAQLANKLTAIEASDMSPQEKTKAKLETIFPKLKKGTDK